MSTLSRVLQSERLGTSVGLSVLALLGALILFSRFTDGVLHAELWGDEGWTFYPQAYQLGLKSLLVPVNGYLNSAQRLGAILTIEAHVPLRWVPTLFVLVALGAQLTVALFLAGPRLATLWPSRAGRVAGAFIYLALPNSVETFGNLTNVQWHLSLLAFMVLAAPAGGTRRWRLFDTIILLLSGLSGPFCIMLMPFAAFRLWQVRHDRAAVREIAWRAGLLMACALVQAGVLMFDNTIRHASGLDTPRVFVRIVALQIVLGLLTGLNTISKIAGSNPWRSDFYAWTVTGLAAVLIVIGFLRGSFLLRAFAIFCAVVFVGELASPVVGSRISPWHSLMTPGACQRYFLIPMLGLAGFILSYAGQSTRIERLVGYGGLAAILLWSVPHDWTYPDLGRTDFVARARAFAAAPVGTRAELPIHPRGARPMVLIKHAV